MICRYCGKTISDDSTFCRECGKKQDPIPASACVIQPAQYGANTADSAKPGKQTGSKNKKVLIFAVVGAAVIVLAAIVFAAVIFFIPAQKYRQGTDLLQKGDYQGAIAVLDDIRDYRDARDKIAEANNELDKADVADFVDDYLAALVQADKDTLDELGVTDFGAEQYFGGVDDNAVQAAFGQAFFTHIEYVIEDDIQVDGSDADVRVTLTYPDMDLAYNALAQDNAYNSAYYALQLVSIIRETELDEAAVSELRWTTLTEKINSEDYTTTSIIQEMSLQKDDESGKWSFTADPITALFDPNRELEEATGEQLWEGYKLGLQNLLANGDITDQEYTDFYYFLGIKNQGWYDVSSGDCLAFVTSYTSPWEIGYGLEFYEAMPGLTLNWNFYTDYGFIGTWSYTFQESENAGGSYWYQYYSAYDPGIYKCLVTLDDGFPIAYGEINVW